MPTPSGCSRPRLDTLRRGRLGRRARVALGLARGADRPVRSGGAVHRRAVPAGCGDPAGTCSACVRRARGRRGLHRDGTTPPGRARGRQRPSSRLSRHASLISSVWSRPSTSCTPAHTPSCPGADPSIPTRRTSCVARTGSWCSPTVLRRWPEPLRQPAHRPVAGRTHDPARATAAHVRAAAGRADRGTTTNAGCCGPSSRRRTSACVPRTRPDPYRGRMRSPLLPLAIAVAAAPPRPRCRFLCLPTLSRRHRSTRHESPDAG